MGCRPSKQTQSQIIPLFNMLVVGYSSVGKTKIIQQLKGQQNIEKNSLQINTILLNKCIKLLTFEVSGLAQRTWKNYYTTSDIVMLVIDIRQHKRIEQINKKLQQIDKNIKTKAKIFIVFNKIDLLEKENYQDNQFVDKEIKKYTQLFKLNQLQHMYCVSKCKAINKQTVKQLGKRLQKFILNPGVQ